MWKLLELSVLVLNKKTVRLWYVNNFAQLGPPLSENLVLCWSTQQDCKLEPGKKFFVFWRRFLLCSNLIGYHKCVLLSNLVVQPYSYFLKISVMLVVFSCPKFECVTYEDLQTSHGVWSFETKSGPPTFLWGSCGAASNLNYRFRHACFCCYHVMCLFYPSFQHLPTCPGCTVWTTQASRWPWQIRVGLGTRAGVMWEFK